MQHYIIKIHSFNKFNSKYLNNKAKLFNSKYLNNKDK